MACNGVPVPGRAKLLNAAAGRRTAVAAEQEFNAPGGAPGIRVRRLEEGYRGLQEKIVQLEGEILSKNS
uniref:Uncharacterized protein n=1 Tax=Klebsiella pneumoniae TaxID=573 RepID=A0A8D9ILR8_KLEPN|nr:hypothetical protein P54MCR8_PROKKA_00005 [Klebsiella pneumoniae]